MIIEMLPIFERGTILSREMLEAMKHNSLHFTELMWEGYSDGIVIGCEVYVSDQTIGIKKGLVRYKSKVYCLPQEMHLEYRPVKQYTVLKLVFGDIAVTEDFQIREAWLTLTEDMEEKEDSFELCRFKLQDGAQLRQQYQNFFDYNTEFDTVNEIYGKWSAMGKEGFSPKILKAFAVEAAKCEMPDSLDQMFCQQIFNIKQDTLNRDCILFYLSKKLKIEMKDYGNIEIYNKLCDCINMIRNEKTATVKPAEKRQRFIIS